MRKGSTERGENKKESKGFERRALLHEMTQETRFTLVQNIMMHPSQMPSIKELVYVNPDKSRSTIREHLDKLIEQGVVKELEAEDAKRNHPKKFFTLTKQGRDILEEFNLLSLEKTLQYVYDNMEKTEEIKRYEKAPRPDPDAGDEPVTVNS